MISRNLPIAALLVAGILAFAWGSSRLVSGPVNAIASKIQAHNASMQIVGAE